MSEELRQDVAETPDAETTPPGEAGQPGPVAFPYAAAGAAFTAWFNDRVRRLTNPTVMLGTKLAGVVELHADGRLECEIETEALEPERQFVAFEATYLDQLVRKIAAIGL
jgi:hypothetical protein